MSGNQVCLALGERNYVASKDWYHHLKLYPEDESGPLSTKKPVVAESYDEIVFLEPSEGLLSQMKNHPAVIVPRPPADITLPPAARWWLAMLTKWMQCGFGVGGLWTQAVIVVERGVVYSGYGWRDFVVVMVWKQ
ncbi:unnamed protein product [Fraxinus pennsylvanica]|uniref:Uncharacterized protein n=1 Tax=Fraxinus pennsylvanica TaxID=56036 RepID=A0AAD1Z947_9LAMI|nr:unnamed protein product [Fraxinus pennsylvanica]